MQSMSRAMEYALNVARRNSIEQAAVCLKTTVEHVSLAGRELAYINMGETYGLTICQEGKDAPFAATWGEWYEAVEREHCENEGVVRCGYCGEFTNLTDPDNWRETVCEHCENLVAG